MERFKLNAAKGALLFCVARAKFSEGIDFKDDLCRSVIFLGIPYVNQNDPYVKEKERYMIEYGASFAKEWKFIEAAKAINQALGRAVRHANDYGSIILIDERYGSHKSNSHSRPVLKNISSWIK